MPNISPEELSMKIAKIMLQCAREYAEEELGDVTNWNYAGVVFKEGGGEIFLYKNRDLHPYGFGDYALEMSNLWRQFRDATQVKGDKPWYACKAVIRNDGNFKMLFEFDKKGKWSIGPANIAKMYDIMLGDIFPETINPEI